MAEYNISTYGERITDIFDDLYGEYENVDAMAEFLAPFAKSGRADRTLLVFAGSTTRRTMGCGLTLEKYPM